VEQVIAALRSDGFLPAATEVVSRWHLRAPYGYPTPTRDRDDALAVLLPALEARRIFSRGRFGAWQYEIGNQDHGCAQGAELADRLLGLGEETTLGRRGGAADAADRTARSAS
jgi:hypothetical protein